MDEYDGIKAERERIGSMPGLQAIAKIETVQRINGILKGNVGELLAIAERMEDPAFYLPISDVNHRERHDTFLTECERLIHNSLAAAKTRVDLLRSFVTRYVVESTPQIAEQYQARIDNDFKSSQMHVFLMKLRDYMLHHRLPVIGTTLHWDRQEGMSYSLNLRCQPLAEDSMFNQATRDWLLQHGEDLDIIDLLRNYYEQVASFDRWFVEAIKSHHRSDIAAYDSAAFAFNQRMGLA